MKMQFGRAKEKFRSFFRLAVELFSSFFVEMNIFLAEKNI